MVQTYWCRSEMNVKRNVGVICKFPAHVIALAECNSSLPQF